MGFLQQLGRANPAQIMRTNEMHESQMEGQALNRQLTEAGLQQMRNKMAVEKQQVERDNKVLSVGQLALGAPEWAAPILTNYAKSQGYVTPQGGIRVADVRAIREAMNSDKTLGAEMLRSKLQWVNNDVARLQKEYNDAVQSGNLKKIPELKSRLGQAYDVQRLTNEQVTGALEMQKKMQELTPSAAKVKTTTEIVDPQGNKRLAIVMDDGRVIPTANVVNRDDPATKTAMNLLGVWMRSNAYATPEQISAAYDAFYSKASGGSQPTPAAGGRAPSPFK